MRIDGHDVTEAIRTPSIDRAAATVAQHPSVRAVLVERQRAYGREGGVVMEGRDIGTVVFPAADVKVYLDASPDERARRRAGDAAHAASREPAGVAAVAEALEARDRTDRTRATSPLTMAPEAVYLDTTDLLGYRCRRAGHGARRGGAAAVTQADFHHGCQLSCGQSSDEAGSSSQRWRSRSRIFSLPWSSSSVS